MGLIIKDFINILKFKFPESEKSQQDFMLDEKEEVEQSSPEVFTLLHKKLETEVKGSKTIELDDFELKLVNEERREED